jgi:8-oxo-dGTP pyrophosphatase MutT (NUDIX family)
MLIDHPLFQVRQDEIELPNGKVIDDYFVRQYRQAVGDFFIELPAGRFNADEEGAEAAGLRELREEIGYIADTVRKIGTLYDKPSKDTNLIHLFIAEDVVKVEEQEDLDVTE